MKFWTIGYGNRKPQDFAEILKQAGITAVCDIRRNPYSAWSGSYTAKELEKLLDQKGINYHWLEELGNPSKENITEFEHLMEAEADKRLARLLELDESAICILCAEMDVKRCHRNIIAQHLGKRGHEVAHL
jgi:uncharacterized protein (DUF488 family)